MTQEFLTTEWHVNISAGKVTNAMLMLGGPLDLTKVKVALSKHGIKKSAFPKQSFIIGGQPMKLHLYNEVKRHCLTLSRKNQNQENQKCVSKSSIYNSKIMTKISNGRSLKPQLLKEMRS